MFFIQHKSLKKVAFSEWLKCSSKTKPKEQQALLDAFKSNWSQLIQVFLNPFPFINGKIQEATTLGDVRGGNIEGSIGPSNSYRVLFTRRAQKLAS